MIKIYDSIFIFCCLIVYSMLGYFLIYWRIYEFFIKIIKKRKT